MLSALLAISGIIAEGLALLAILYGLSRYLGREKPRPPLVIYGEEVPAAAKAAGGAARGSSRGRTDDIAHRGKGL